VVEERAADAQQIVALGSRLGSVVAVSSASVYADSAGRTLDEATGVEDFPQLPVPVGERQATAPPGDATYSTRKVAMEQTLLQSSLRATVVRPCAIHGPGSSLAREWFFVKRVLDGRRAVALAHRGSGRFHTTSVANLAELIRLAAHRPGSRVLNAGDPDPPTVLEIGRAIASALDHEWTEVLLPGPEESNVGDHPWNAPYPFVVDMVESVIELGYRPVTTYERAVEKTCRWLVDATRDRDWREALLSSVRHLEPMFDYAAEDAFLTRLGETAVTA
jgi:nucleoside-diphosphate-sugar epimerase